MARLVIFDDRVRAVDLPDHAVIVGRSRKVDIPIRDPLLSRKHLTISPVSEEGEVENGSSFRLMDLKSANGTFVNGARTDKCDLEYDDVIEIGNTVMVLLDSESWSRGEGLPSLRNPLKAQELMQRLRQRTEETQSGSAIAPRGPSEGELAAAVADRVALMDAERWAGAELGAQGTFHERLVDLAESVLLEAVVVNSPALREAVLSALERVSRGIHAHRHPDQLRAAIRSALLERLAAGDEKTPTERDDGADGIAKGAAVEPNP